ncbi:hypothetical protein MTO96_004492 [Rhipicephalus appendiculatus]
MAVAPGDGHTMYVASLDVGSSGVRCHIYDRQARVCGTASQRLQTECPSAGVFEVDPEHLWQAAKDTLRAALKGSSVSASSVKALGISTQRATFACWDKTTGQLLHKFISWKDTRAESLCREWNSSARIKAMRMGASFLYCLTHKDRYLAASVLRFESGLVVMRLLWALKNIPGLREGAREGRVLMGTVDSFLLWRLTGGRVHATDPSNACITGLFDPFTMEWSRLLTNMLDIPVSMLPKVLNTSCVFGVTDPEILGAEIPIACLAGDQQASAFGECCFLAGDVKCTMGTGTFFNANTADQPHASTVGGVALIGWLHTVLLFLVPLARYRAPPETGQAQYFFKKTAATRGHHKSPDSTPGWPSRPFKSPKRRGATLTLTSRASTSGMQRLTKPSKPPTTSTAPAVSPASCFAAVTTVPTLSQPGDVNNPTPTALGQPAAFLSCTHTPATSNAGSFCATPSLKATFQPTCVVTMPTTDNALSAAKMLEPVPVVTQTPAFVVTNASTVAPESESRITALALQSAALAAIPTGSAPGLATVNAESPKKSVLKSGVPLVPTGLPTTILADDTPTEMDFAASQGNDDDASHPEGSWTTVSANRKPASTARPRTELITVGIQLPPGTLTPKLPLYDLLASIIAAANLSPKTSAEVTLQAEPAQSLVFLKTHSPLTAHLLPSLTNLELNGIYPVVGWKIRDQVTYLAEGSSFDTGTVVDWAQEMGLINNADESAEVAESVDSSAGVFFIPAFSGLQAPVNDAYAAAGFLGLSTSTRPAHMVRAMLESLAFRTYQLHALLKGTSGLPAITGSVRFTGGVTRNTFLMQLLADLLQEPIVCSSQRDSSALGAAYLAGLAVGFWKDLAELRDLQPKGVVFKPRVEQKTSCQTLFNEWCRAVERFTQWHAPAGSLWSGEK